jgi:hypothetical protein
MGNYYRATVSGNIQLHDVREEYLIHFFSNLFLTALEISWKQSRKTEINYFL